MAGKAVVNPDSRLDILRVLKDTFGVHPKTGKVLVGRGYVSIAGQAIGLNEIKPRKGDVWGQMLELRGRGQVRLVGSAPVAPDNEQLTLGAS